MNWNLINLVKWPFVLIKAKRFARDMECVIHAIHPEPKFKIHAQVDRQNLNQVTFNIDTTDDKIMGCFILIQEALRVKENDA